MSTELIGIIGIIAMLVLMFLKFPIALAMLIPSFLGILYLRDWTALSTVIQNVLWDHSFNYTLITIPLFILMGELLFISGLSSDLFKTFKHWMGKLHGGLAMATIGASGIFAAASGSALANTGTMGMIAAKEMTDAGYNKSLAAGSIVAGGTLGVLIPPSTVFIIYGTLSEQSIGKLLIAGIIPGIVLVLLYLLTVFIIVKIRPSYAPSHTITSTWRDRFTSLYSIVWILLLFIIVIGGMYIGIFSPTEAAGIGAFGAMVITLFKRKLTFAFFIAAAARTLVTTGFLFAIMLSAFILNYFLAITRVPILLSDFLSSLQISDVMIFALIIVLYLILGAVMDSLAMIVITIPIVLPLIESMGHDLIWFGVIIVLLIEMAGMSPPLGMNVFVLKGVTDIALEKIFIGALWFMIPILVMIVLLYIAPDIALYLPSKME